MSSSRSDGGISPRKAAILEALRRARGFTAERSQILPRDKSIPAPLSYAQQRLWFIEQMEPGSPAYIGNTALRLRGKVRVDLMKRAVQQLVERHDMLRTSFAWLDGEPVQAAQEHWDGNLEMVDLRGAPDPKQQLRALIREDAQRPCDFTRGSLFRVTLFSLDDEEWVLLLTLHHIASDGWSMGIVLRELSVLYGACVREESIKLRELPVQYADFAVWQREWLRGGALEEQMAYWRAQLQGTTGVLELPDGLPAASGQRMARETGRICGGGESCGRPEKAGPPGRCDPVHDLAGGFAGDAVALHGPERYQHRDTNC